MKIGLVGFGYWGKILYRNLVDLGIDPIVCEPNLVDNNNLLDGKKVVEKYEDLEVDKVFVAVPATAHHDIVKHFLSNGVDVFCEKPLGMYTHEVEEMYKIAETNDANLFVDWLFTFNSQVERLVDLLSHSAPIRNITMNFINKGPLRYDCNAKYDLASHHVSILQTIFRTLPDSWTWINYNRDPKQKVEDSCVGFLKYGDCQVMINASWEHEIKGREVVFTLVDGTYILWDDMTQTLKYVSSKDEMEYTGGNSSPLHNSIKTFLYVKNFSYIKQKELTKQITKVLEENHG
tara:strand:- start:2616 stop:3485 length:870 start_codon:yes stop_codon:yes gene_type:complete